MKKKIFLALAISTLLICLFAVGVSASSDFSTVTISDTIDLSGMSTDTTSRVVLATVDENGEVTAYTTYPSQYIVKSGNTLSYDFSKINTAFGTSYDKDSIVSFEVPTTITSIPDNTGVLRAIKRLAYIEFKSSSISFAGNALRSCKALVEVVLPATVSYDKGNGYQFTDCTSLTTVRCPGGLKVLSGYLFSGCKKLTYVDLSNEFTQYPTQCFYDCSSFTQEIDLTNAKTIKTKAFQNCKATFVNANSLSCVEADGFRNATGMTSVEFASDLSLIGNYAFNGTKLTSAKFNGGSFTIGTQAFNSVSTLVGEIDLTGCTSIGSTAFKGTSITSVKIPAGFTSIGDYAFQNCSKITSLEFLGDAAPNAVIGTAAFENCYTIGNVFIPEGVTTINNCAFNAAGVTNLSFPSTLTTVNGNSTFNVWGKSSVIKSEYMLKSVTGLENTKITTIVSSMFRGQSQWKPENIILPNTVETIQDSYAFADVGMTNIYLGANLKTLGNEAFTACANLKNVYIPGTITAFGNNPFNGKGVNFFVTSEDTDYLAALAAKAGTGENYVSIDDYKANPENYASGKWIIFGCNACDTFYKGVHNINPEAQLRYDFIGEKYISSYCSFADCTRCPEADVVEVVEPLFTSKGYSKSDDAFMYDLKVNFDAIEAYKDFCKTTFEKDVTINYGLVVSGKSTYTELLKADGSIMGDDVLKIIFDETPYTNVQIKMNNINTDELKAIYVHACAYIIEDGAISYIGDGKTDSVSTAICHNDIKDE